MAKTKEELPEVTLPQNPETKTVTTETVITPADQTPNLPTPPPSKEDVKDNGYDLTAEEKKQLKATQDAEKERAKNPVNASVLNITKAPSVMVSVRGLVDHEHSVAGVNYHLKKGQSKEVPSDVAAILQNAGVAVRDR